MSNARELAELSGSYGTGGFVGMKNRIINGAMMIDQRNAGASVTANNNVFAVDRFKFQASQSSKGTLQQSTTAPTGFVNSLLFTSSSAYSITSTDFFVHALNIEGLNVADLAWGTASAATVTLSFWVRSSLTGTFGGVVQNSASDRSYPFTYTISAANTFEQKTITIAGDTSGTWLTTNGTGIRIYMGLGVGATYSGAAGTWAGANYIGATGATSVVGTSGATFYITGVQLEKGSTATSFDYRPYGTELALCQRYCYVPLQGTMTNAAAFSSTRFDAFLSFPVTMRATPAGSYASGSTYYRVYLGGTSSSFTTLLTNGINANGALLYNASVSGLATGAGGWLETQSAPYGAIVFSAEL